MASKTPPHSSSSSSSVSSSASSLRENRCWRIAQFKNNFGDLQQIDVDTLETAHDPLLHCSSPEMALRVTCKSPLRRRCSPSPTQSLALANLLASGSGACSPLFGARSPLLIHSRLRDSTGEFSRPPTPLSSSSIASSTITASAFEHSVRPFCDCLSSSARFARTPDLVCDCGEPQDNELSPLLWLWEADGTENEAARISLDGRQVSFHHETSYGTAAVRGTCPLATDQQHFWELKITSSLYGTDVMIGLGTDQVNLLKHKNSFCSMLGEDNESWGFSYLGFFRKGGESVAYAPGFNHGCIVGVHLDTWHGQLSFHLNRQPLGVACRSSAFKDRQLFPIVSSTAARSGIRLLRTRSCSTSLQYLVCRRLRELVPSHVNVLDALDAWMPPGLVKQLRNKDDWLLEAQPLAPTSSTGRCPSPSHSSSGSRSPDIFHLPFKRRRVI